MTEAPRIISASRRTDIPAWYTPWLLNRLQAGFCHYPNPRFPAKLHRVSLRSADVLGIVFWTRNPAPLLPHLGSLDHWGYDYYFQYTLTGYPRALEPFAPPVEQALATFRSLAQRLGPRRVIWRYDPIILGSTLTVPWHRDNFRRLADALDGATKRVVISVIDPYRKNRRLVEATVGSIDYHPEAYRELLQYLAQEAADRHLPMESCAEPSLSIPGISAGRCIDAGMFRAAGRHQRHGLRPGCGCHRSIDIGVNDTCPCGCCYCYATADPRKAREAAERHNPRWSCITGDIPETAFCAASDEGTP
ncbi:DUF1848 domain-containing protein [Trichlorobacter ammonificans]|uniref:DUF1848 domain-containing protein n=1 Tax=Trichlorobacter ammonificans TaxID=2916410 RepID=A0ABM9D750_9BACT|nr:DUF1848 domain-containing protein [Trichlorobacter ammonificans]CAH2030847.1 conserved protein of unknown function [Trichlorobacter ammonificans]